MDVHRASDEHDRGLGLTRRDRPARHNALRRSTRGRDSTASPTTPSQSGSIVDELILRAARHTVNFAHGSLPITPAHGLVIVTCMDARIDPAKLFGLRDGDAHVLRNAGGIVTDDVIRSLVVSQHLVGTHEVMVIMHTNCGLMGLDDDAFVESVAGRSGSSPLWGPGGFTDLDTEVRRSVVRIQSSPYLPAPNARGFVYDVTTGALREVA